jgi:hypothetical protein
MCGRPLAFRQTLTFELGYAQFVGAEPQNSLWSGTEAQSASAHRAASRWRESLLGKAVLTTTALNKLLSLAICS